MTRPPNAWVIGRFPSCDIRVDDEYASGQHCLVRRLPDGRFVVADLGSTNGTYLIPATGSPLKITVPTIWHPGVTLQVGRSKIPQPK